MGNAKKRSTGRGEEMPVSPFVEQYLSVIRKNILGLRGEMSQKEFADKTGISRTTVQRIEDGNNFEIISLLKIAEAFQIPPFNLCMTEKERINLQEGYKIWKKEIVEELLEELRKEFKK
jgi:transcriptional regulator with XRE-family HTH domain